MTIANEQLIELTAALRPSYIQQALMPVILTAGIALLVFFNGNVTDVAKLQVQVEILSDVVTRIDGKLDKAIEERFTRSDAATLADRIDSYENRLSVIERRVLSR